MSLCASGPMKMMRVRSWCSILCPFTRYFQPRRIESIGELIAQNIAPTQIARMLGMLAAEGAGDVAQFRFVIDRALARAGYFSEVAGIEHLTRAGALSCQDAWRQRCCVRANARLNQRSAAPNLPLSPGSLSMQCVHLRMNYGDDDAPTEAAAVRRQKLREVASLYAQVMILEDACDLVGLPTPAVESLPVEFNHAPMPDQIKAECDAICPAWSEKPSRGTSARWFRDGRCQRSPTASGWRQRRRSK